MGTDRLDHVTRNRNTARGSETGSASCQDVLARGEVIAPTTEREVQSNCLTVHNILGAVNTSFRIWRCASSQLPL